MMINDCKAFWTIFPTLKVFTHPGQRVRDSVENVKVGKNIVDDLDTNINININTNHGRIMWVFCKKDLYDSGVALTG